MATTFLCCLFLSRRTHAEQQQLSTVSAADSEALLRCRACDARPGYQSALLNPAVLVNAKPRALEEEHLRRSLRGCQDFSAQL